MSSSLLSISRMKSARACLRHHEIRYLQRIRPVEDADTLRFGSLFHRGLEAWWLAAQAGEPRLEAALAAVEGEADPFDRARARALLVGYDARWCLVPMEVLGVEVEFRMPLVNPATGRTSPLWTMGGKVDAIIRDELGRVLVVEHKTSAEDVSAGSDYWKRLTMDGQVSVYFDGARSLGHDVEGCLYDVISKPGTRPYKATPEEQRKYTEPKSRACKECKKKTPAPGPHIEDDIECVDGRIVTDPGGRLYANLRAEDETPLEYEVRLLDAIAEAPEKFFARGEVARLESELHEARADAWDLARSMREAELADRAPRNPDACVRYGRTCEYWDVCTGQASLEDPSRFVQLDTPHPELTSDVPTATTEENSDGRTAA